MFEHWVISERLAGSNSFAGSENPNVGFISEADMFTMLEREGWGLIDVPVVNGFRVYYFRRRKPKKRNFLVLWAEDAIIWLLSHKA